MTNSFLKISFCTIILFFGTVQAQNTPSEQYHLAESLYEKEQYFDAVTELKRLLFFDSEGKYSFKANELIGQCFKKGAKFSDAINYFTLAEINAETTEQLYHARIEIIRANILRRTTGRALKLLDSLQTDNRFSDKTDEIKYWRGWAYIFADDWEQAAGEFSRIDSAHALYELSNKVASDKYSVTLAKVLSYIIPGAGQFYTGEYVSGLLSLGWNVIWGYVTINAWAANRVFDGIAVANFLWLRFYRGNLENAEKFALEKNLDISNNALRFLQYGFTGTKP